MLNYFSHTRRCAPKSLGKEVTLSKIAWTVTMPVISKIFGMAARSEGIIHESSWISVL
jgi:hypothetical protein